MLTIERIRTEVAALPAVGAFASMVLIYVGVVADGARRVRADRPSAPDRKGET